MYCIMKQFLLIVKAISSTIHNFLLDNMVKLLYNIIIIKEDQLMSTKKTNRKVETEDERIKIITAFLQ